MRCENIYLADCQFAEVGKGVMPYALDGENARRLWDVSEAMVGEKFAY